MNNSAVLLCALHHLTLHRRTLHPEDARRCNALLAQIGELLRQGGLTPSDALGSSLTVADLQAELRRYPDMHPRIRVLCCEVMSLSAEH